MDQHTTLKSQPEGRCNVSSALLPTSSARSLISWDTFDMDGKHLYGYTDTRVITHDKRALDALQVGTLQTT